jgi:phosphatidylglycerol:prolipoprotein diacylglycerol transferase
MIPASLVAFPNIDPVLLSIGPFELRWYGLAYVAGLIFAAWYMRRLVTMSRLWAGQKPTMTPEQIDEMFVWFALGVVVGGRLGYVLFYKPLFYLANPLDILKVWDGGMSFHGGFLGVVVACWFYGKKIGQGLDRMLDLGAASTPVGLGLGRLANFINGELYGRATDVPWAMIFPTDKARLPRHPSQLYEAFLEGAVLFALVRIATHRYQALAHPGRASGIYALSYALMRIVSEFFREPDAHIGYLAGGLTQGMILSLPLALIGVWLLVRSRGKVHVA